MRKAPKEIIALATLLIFIIGLVISASCSPAVKPTPSGPPAVPPPPKPANLKNVVLRLDDLPAGWHQAVFQPDMKGDYRVDGVRVIFRNKKYATPQEEISVANNVWLCEEKEAAVYLFERERKYYKEISLADRAVYDAATAHLRIIFVKGLFLVELEYYGIPLENVTETEKFQFIYSLAKIVAQRIP